MKKQRAQPKKRPSSAPKEQQPVPAEGGFVGWVARNVMIIKLVLLLLMFLMIGLLAYFFATRKDLNPDFGTNPPTPTTLTPSPGGSVGPSPSIAPTPAEPLDGYAIAGIVVGTLALVLLVIYGIYRAVQQGKTGSFSRTQIDF